MKGERIPEEENGELTLVDAHGPTSEKRLQW